MSDPRPLLLLFHTCVFVVIEGCGGAGPVTIPLGPDDAGGARSDAPLPEASSPHRGDGEGEADSDSDASPTRHRQRDGGLDAEDEAATVPPPVDASTCPYSRTGNLGTFLLTGEPGDESGVVATSVAGVAVSALHRAPDLEPLGGYDSINSSDWGIGGAPDGTRYYTFTVTPVSGCEVTIASLAIDVRASADGPADIDLATSLDGFATHGAAFGGTSAGTVPVGATAAGPIEVRVYGYQAYDSEGSLRIEDTLTIRGTLR